MKLLDLFRPKWRHSDTEVRAEAVRHLLDDEDAEAIAQVALQDPDPRVRKVAVRKLRDTQLLAIVADKDADDGLRRFAGERLRDLLVDTAVQGKDEARSLQAVQRITAPRALVEVACASRSAAVRDAAVARLGDPHLLAEVALNAADGATRQQAAQRVEDAKVALEIALGDREKEAGLAALGKIGERAVLETIAKDARSKAVRAAARERLAAASGRGAGTAEPVVEQVALERRRERQVELCAQVEAIQTGTDWERHAAIVKAARAAWAELGSMPGDDALRDRFYAACERFARQHEEFQQAELERATAAARERRRAAARAPEPAAAAPIEESTEQQDAGETLGRVVADAEALSGPPRSIERQYRYLERVWRDLEQHAGTAAEELHARFVAVGERIAAESAAERERLQSEQAEVRADLEGFCAWLEELAQSDSFRDVSHALKDAGNVFERMGLLPRDQQPTLRARFQAARQVLVVHIEQLREAEDWRRWANVPQLEQLCLKVEALREEQDAVKAARELRALQKEWKEVGPATREKSEALWARFKQASDEVHKRCQEQFVVLDQARAETLTRKLEMCAQVEALADSTEWKKTTDAIKALQAEWKALGPVPKDQAEQIWQRFRGACDRFFERLKAHHQQVDAERERNLKHQEELCAKVEALADSTQWKSTADTIKALQAEWKAAGPAPRDRADQVWQRFRGACDRFFERRKVHFDQLDSERAQNLKQKEELCEKVEAMVDSDEGDDQPVADLVKELMAQWKTIGPAPKDVADAVWERFCKACDLLRDVRR